MKRFLALLLALVLTLTCIPVPHAHATQVEEPHEHTHEEEALAVEEAIPAETDPEETLPAEEDPVPQQIFLSLGQIQSMSHLATDNNDRLFANYVDRVFYPAQAQAMSSEAGDRLSGDLRKLYDGICWMFKKVADGQRTSTEITVGKGLEYNVTLNGDSLSNNDIYTLLIAVLSDMAYEQYWFDKTTGLWFGRRGSGYYFGFVVAKNYRGTDEFHTDAAITGAATKSAANARKIVADNAGKTDYEKLRVYSSTICDLVEYDYAAASRGDYARDNDPWQMIHTFDGDPSTNIVCEGYSKSFKYLCDQSDFDADIIAYTVTGNAGGPHMWNVVSVGSRNYHTDVTFMDGGVAAFMAGGSGSIAGGYVVKGYRYFYDQDTTGLWGTGSGSILKLSSTDYTPGSECTSHTPGPAATCTEPQTCTRCGYEIAPALGHNPGAAATCTKPQTCTRCGAEITAALGHRWVQEAVKDGKIYYRCSRCGETKTEDENRLPFSDYEWEVLILTNKVRLKAGLDPLTGFATIQNATDVRATELMDLFDHTRPDGRSCFTALGEAGVTYTAAGENIAAGYGTPTSVMTGWINSSGHRANILSSSFNHMGVGYCYDADSYYDHHWVQMFVSSCGEKNTDFTLVFPNGTTFKAGTAIDDMGIFVKVTNSVYGLCYLPVTAELCSGYDPDSGSDQTVTVSALGLKRTFVISRGAHEHTYGDWYEVTAPTCTEAGLERRDCSCGIQESRATDPLGHDPDREPSCTRDQICNRCNRILTPALGHDPVTVPGKAPTCTEAGLTDGSKCSRCRSTLQKQETVPALGHDPGPGATCTEAQSCLRCGGELQPKLGHAPVTVPGKAPTCTQPGLTDGRQCARCDLWFTAQEEIPPLGHEPVTDPGKTPTCTQPGLTDGSHCDRCGLVLVKQNEIPATDHTPGPGASCTEPWTCVVCGMELAPAAGHTPGKAATCTEAQVCTVCGVQIAPALGHAPGEAPTCEKGQSCIRCGTGLSPALGHDPVTVPGSPATCTETGLTDGSRCDRCGLTLTEQEEIPALGHEPGPAPTAEEPQVCLRCGIVLQEKLPHIRDCGFFLPDRVVYTGKALTPAVSVLTPDKTLLLEGTDYTLTYKNNTKIGNATVTVTGLGQYGGTTTLNFSIVPGKAENLRLSSVTSTTAKVAYGKVPGAASYNIYVDGQLKGSTSSTSYTVKKLKAGQSYEITVEAVKKVGSVSYSGALSDALTVRPGTSIAKYTASLSYTSTDYDGTEKLPTPKLRSSSKKYLVLGQDYTVSYENNVQIGTATVTFTGIGKYAGSITKTFRINLGKVTGVKCAVADPTTLQVTFDPVAGAQFYKIYVGGKLKATAEEPLWVYEKLKTGTTYKITVKAGTVIDGKEVYGSLSSSVSGKPGYDFTKCTAALSYETTTYSGKSKSPTVTVYSENGTKLKKDTHYTVSCKNNKSVGLATVTVTGKGSYSGVITLSFEILPGKVTGLSFRNVNGDTAKVAWKKVSGASWYRIRLDGELLDTVCGTSYTLTGLEAGKTHQVQILAGKTVDCVDYCGEPVEKELTSSWDLSKLSVQPEADSFVYTGEAVCPAVTVRDGSGSELTEGVDYTVNYRNNVKIGKASLTLTGMGKCRGSVTVSFKIVPGQVENVELVSVSKTTAKIRFDKVEGASTYYIYVNGKQKGSTSSASYTLKGLKSGKTYGITVVAAKTVKKTAYKGEASQVLTVTTK